MANIPTLPGVRVSLSDSYYSANDTNPDAQRVLLIAADGTVSSASHYNPIQYFSEAAVIEACGLGSDAHTAYVQAIRSGATNVFLATVDVAQCSTPAGREAELVKALAFADMVEPDLIVPFGFYANEIVPSSGSDITRTISGVVGTEGATFVTATTSAAHTFSVGGSVTISGVTPAALNGVKVIASIVSPTKFTYACTALTAQNVTDLAVSSATAVKSASARLSANAVNTATACYLMTRDLNPCECVMGMVPIGYVGGLPTATEIEAYKTALDLDLVASLTNEVFAPLANVKSALAAVSVEGVESDLGKFVFPFVGSVIVRGQSASEVSSTIDFTGGEAVAAGQIYSTPLEDAITASPLTNVISITNNFSRAQKLALLSRRVNPICQSSSGTIVTLDGWTFASPDKDGNDSVYSRISTVRIVHEIVKSTRNELEKFIGMQASTARLNSIETKLRTVYTAFKQAGVLRNAEFKIEFNQTTGTLKVDLNLVPFGEMREVIVTVAVKISA